MKQNTRKITGIFALIALLFIYPMLAVFLYEQLPAMPWWGQVLFFAVAGIGWAFPAGVVIKWMAYPDPD